MKRRSDAGQRFGVSLPHPDCTIRLICGEELLPTHTFQGDFIPTTADNLLAEVGFRT
jgi:hypothetical protein